MKTETMICHSCRYTEQQTCEEGETHEGLKCPNCEEPMGVKDESEDDLVRIDELIDVLRFIDKATDEELRQIDQRLLIRKQK